MGRIEFSEDEVGDEFPSETPELGWRDMLLPARLLTETSWWADPLVVYAAIRSRRLGRVVLIRAFECILFFYAFFLLIQPISSRAMSVLSVFVYVFLLLRYHLFVNDLSMFTKSLSRERLEELMLTRFGASEYFLHQFLIFCQSYRLIYGFLGLLMMFIFVHSLMLTILFVFVMQVWLAGVYQFVLEWKFFAGGRWSRLRDLSSITISLALTTFICVFDFFGGALLLSNFNLTSFFLIPLFFLLSWAGAFLLVFKNARRINDNAEAILRNRVDPAFDEEQYSLRPLDLILPWRWANPFFHSNRSVPLLGVIGIWMKSLLYGSFFVLLLSAITYASLDLTQIDWARFLKFTIPSAFLLAVYGLHQGQLIACDARPIRGLHLKKSLGGLGISAIAVAIAVFSYESIYYAKIGLGFLIGRHLGNSAYGLAALASGFLFSDRKIISIWDRLMVMAGMALFFAEINYLTTNGIRIITRMPIGPSNIAAPFLVYLIVYLPANSILKPIWTQPEKSIDSPDQLSKM